MAHYYSTKLRISFDEALSKIAQTLQRQGFGIITTIDVKDTLKRKLNIDFRHYKILGACNPEFAYKAISMESHIGLMLPCNILVQQHENGEVEVSATNPLDTLDSGLTTTNLTVIASEIGNRLRAAIDDLHRDINEPNGEEVLPSITSDENVLFPIYG